MLKSLSKPWAAMFTLFRDSFTLWLTARGQAPELYQPAAMLGAPPVGWLHKIGLSNVVYRVPEETPHIMILVLLERDLTRAGLRSPFADLVKFLLLVRKSATGITRVHGHLESLSSRPTDSLPTDKMSAFYERYLPVKEYWEESGVAWCGGELAEVVPPLPSQRRRLCADLP